MVTTTAALRDHSRIIRLTYYYPQYIRLAPASYAALAYARRGIRRPDGLFKTGSIQFSPVDHPYRYEIDKYTGAMDETGVPYDRVDADEIVKRFPQFRLKIRSRWHLSGRYRIGRCKPGKCHPHSHGALSRCHYVGQL